MKVVEIYRPVTRRTCAVNHPDTIREIGHKAVRLAETGRPGACHIELAEGVAAKATGSQHALKALNRTRACGATDTARPARSSVLRHGQDAQDGQDGPGATRFTLNDGYDRLQSFPEARTANGSEVRQAVIEVAADIKPIIDRSDAYSRANIFERLVEPDRMISFRVVRQNDTGGIEVSRGPARRSTARAACSRAGCSSAPR